MDPRDLIREIGRFPADFIHHGQPMAVTITQSTEIGTVYSPDEIDAIATICRGAGIPLHMDGARFANALVSLGLSPAEMTWKRGVDIMSFGATKNGCWCAEALVFFDPDKARDLPFIRKRAAQLFSKTRFISAQFEAYFADGLWLDLARHANAQAQKLKQCIEQSSKLRLAWQPQANEVFAVVSRGTADRLRAKGCLFAPWNPPRTLAAPVEKDEILMRLVTSFATTDEHVDRFAELVR
jgi:threonine aldolase